MDEKRWAISGDGETYEGDYASREEAISAGRKRVADGEFGGLWIGVRVAPNVPDLIPPFLVDDILERMSETAGDNEFDPEWVGDWPDAPADAKKALDNVLRFVISTWVAAHCPPRFFNVEEVGEIALGEAVPEPTKCRVCGCTEDAPCVTEDGPCFWIPIETNLCSACAAGKPAVPTQAERSDQAHAKQSIPGPAQVGDVVETQNDSELYVVTHVRPDGRLELMTVTGRRFSLNPDVLDHIVSRSPLMSCCVVEHLTAPLGLGLIYFQATVLHVVWALQDAFSDRCMRDEVLIVYMPDAALLLIAGGLKRARSANRSV